MPAPFPAWWFENARVLWALVRSPLFDPLLTARWMGQCLVLGGLIVAADFLFGAALVCWLEGKNRRRLPPTLMAAAALAAGSGLAGLGVFCLGVAHVLTPAALGALAAAMAAAGLLGLGRLGAWRRAFAFTGAFAIRPGQRPAALVLALLLAAPCLAHLLDLFTPVLEYDSTLYHMTAAKRFLATRSLAYDPGLRYNAHPQLSALLYLRQWALLGDDSLAKLLNLEFSLMLLLVLTYAARELRWKTGWIPGVLFLISSPTLCWVSKVEYADLPLAAYLAVAAALLFHHFRHPSAPCLVPAGLALGFAGALKLQGLVLAACVAAAFVAAALAARRRPVSIARSITVLILLVALAGAGWWTRAWVNTGSPVYPFLAGAQPDVDNTLRVNLSYGLGRDWRAFLLLPWRMLVGPPEAFADAFVFGAPGLLLLAAALAALARARKLLPPEVLFLAASCAAYTAFWFFSGQVMRYLASLLPMMAILFLWLLIQAGLSRRTGALASVLLVAAVPSALLASTLFRRGVLPAVTYAAADQARAAALPYYHVLRALNSRASPADTTYLLFCEDYRYYLDTAARGDWYGELSYPQLARGVASEAQLVARLKDAGIRWVVVARDRARTHQLLFDWDFSHSGLVRQEVEIPGARVLYSDRRFGVYQLW